MCVHANAFPCVRVVWKPLSAFALVSGAEHVTKMAEKSLRVSGRNRICRVVIELATGVTSASYLISTSQTHERTK